MQVISLTETGLDVIGSHYPDLFIAKYDIEFSLKFFARNPPQVIEKAKIKS